MTNRCSIFVLVLASMLCGCKTGFAPEEDDTDTPDSDPSFNGYYNDAIWQLTLDDEDTDFRLSRRTEVDDAEDLIIRGSYTRRSSNFTQLNVETVTGSNGPSNGDTITIMEIAANIILIAPFISEVTTVGVLVDRGVCPSSNTESNWINSLPTPSDADDYFGTLTYNSQNDITTLTSRIDLDEDFTLDTEDISLGATFCDDGIAQSQNDLHFHGSNNAAIIVTDLDTDTRLRFANTIKQIGSATAFDGDYIGFYVNDGDTSQRQFAYVAGSCTSGLCDFDRVDNTGSIIINTPDSMQLNLQDEDNIDPDNIGTGWASGTLFESDGIIDTDSQRVACTIDIDAGGVDESKDIRFLSCIGNSVNDPEKQFTLFVLSE